METMITLERAREIVYAHTYCLDTEVVKLKEAYSRILAQEVLAPIDTPPFDRSPLDGYTYQAKSIEAAPLQLTIIDEIPAGGYSERVIGEGECAKIFTGAPIPSGANCVVRIEDTELVEDGKRVLIKKPVLPHSNIVKRGEEINSGKLLFNQGAFLTPAVIGVLASMGIEQIEVHKRIKIGLVVTGSELVEVGNALNKGQIYNSNSYTLRGMLSEMGCEVEEAPLVGDSLEEITQILKDFRDKDMVISTGGASVGEYDLVREALVGADAELLFWKVDFKPGTPIAVAKRDKQLLFSLSGNPAAALITFELIVKPALRKLAGLKSYEQPFFSVKMIEGFGKVGRQRRFLRAQAVLKNGEIWADPAKAQESGVLLSMAQSNLLVEVPIGIGPVKKGDILNACFTGMGEI